MMRFLAALTFSLGIHSSAFALPVASLPAAYLYLETLPGYHVPIVFKSTKACGEAQKAKLITQEWTREDKVTNERTRASLKIKGRHFLVRQECVPMNGVVETTLTFDVANSTSQVQHHSFTILDGLEVVQAEGVKETTKKSAKK